MNLLLTKFRLSHSGYSSNFTFFALSAITAFAMGIILYYFATTEQRQANLSNLKHATSLYASPRAFPDFILTNHHGQEFTHKNLKDVWNFIFFGFTHCPDICPLTLSTIDQVVNNLASKNQFAVQTVFISVDPKRDSQKQLRDYVQYFNQDMIGLTGGNQELKKPNASSWRSIYHSI